MDKQDSVVVGCGVFVFAVTLVAFFVTLVERDTCRAELAECREPVTWCEASDE